MRTARVVTAVIGVLILGGCETFKPSTYARPEWPWAKNEKCASVTGCDITLIFNQASQHCAAMMRYAENRNFNTRVGRFGIGLIGTVAGSVIAPVTTGSTAKAWSGVSGASNALQSQMDSVFSSSNHIRRRAAIAQAAREAKLEFLAESSAEKKTRYSDRYGDRLRNSGSRC